LWPNRSDRREPACDPPTIDFGGGPVPIHVTRSHRARSMRLRADAIDNAVRITVPYHVPLSRVLRMVEENRDWLSRRMAAVPAAVPLIPGACFAFMGEPLRIEWTEGHSRTIHRDNDCVRLGGPEHLVEARLLRWLKEEARLHMAADLGDYCLRGRLPVPRLSIGDARGRWGSCSRPSREAPAHIRMNWRLVMAPTVVRRSVVAHEVAHLVHMNHSKNFYTLLDDLFEGNRSTCDRWLKQHGAGLHRVGGGIPR